MMFSKNSKILILTFLSLHGAISLGQATSSPVTAVTRPKEAEGRATGDFKICEVVGITYPNYYAHLICYEETNTVNTWVTCNSSEDEKCRKPEPAPLFPKCPETASLSSEITQLRMRIATQLAGRCLQQAPTPINSTITNIKDISYIYMALKDNLVLSDVSIVDKQLISATLSRQERKGDQLRKFGEAVMNEMHNMGQAINNRQSPQQPIKPTQEQMCANTLQNMIDEKEMLTAKAAAFEAAKNNCGN